MLDAGKICDHQQPFSTHWPCPTGALDLLEQLQEEVRLSEYLAVREKERRQKCRERVLTVPISGNKAKISRRRAKSTPAMSWLRERICSLVYGDLTPDGVRPSNTIKELIGRWNLSCQLRKLSNYKLADHFAGAATHYFFGNGNPKDEYTLAMIDIDVLKSRGRGSPEGALAFAEHLKRSRWPGLYFERSTGGKGVHGYLVVRKLGNSSDSVNAALRRLQDWLVAESARFNADIELVEVKGSCMEITFNFGMMNSAKYGSFAKLPREARRFDEWQATTVLSLGDILGTSYDPEDEVIPLGARLPAATATKAKPKKPMPGSVSGKFVTEEELACLPRYESLYRKMTGGRNLKAGKWAVTSHDFAVAMLLLRYFKRRPNLDGSLPTDRVAELWTGLYTAGDVQRPWNHHRWKAVRDFLSENGHIHWLDHRYQYGERINGKFVPGVACKFEITDEFSVALDLVAVETVTSTGGASLMDTAPTLYVPAKGCGRHLIPERYPIRVEKERLFLKSAYDACESLYAA